MEMNKELMAKAEACVEDIKAITEKHECGSEINHIIMAGALYHVSAYINPLMCNFAYAKKWAVEDKVVAYIPKYLKEEACNEAVQLFRKYTMEEFGKAFELLELPKEDAERQLAAEFKQLL